MQIGVRKKNANSINKNQFCIIAFVAIVIVVVVVVTVVIAIFLNLVY